MEVVVHPAHGEVWLVTLDPALGSEIRKTRPCVAISPDEMNRHLRTVIVAPMTTVVRSYPLRVTVRFGGKQGQAALHQIRAIDGDGLVKKLGTLPSTALDRISSVLAEMFART